MACRALRILIKQILRDAYVVTSSKDKSFKKNLITFNSITGDGDIISRLFSGYDKAIRPEFGKYVKRFSLECRK